MTFFLSKKYDFHLYKILVQIHMYIHIYIYMYVNHLTTFIKAYLLNLK